MSAATPTPIHYALEVRRLTNLKRESRTPGLSVKVSLEKVTIGETEIIRENKPPSSNATVTFSSSDDWHILGVCVIEEARGQMHRFAMRHRQIGNTNISIKELLLKCVNGEASLELYTSSGRERAARASVGTIRLYLKDVDIENRVGIDVDAARRHIQQIRWSANASDSTASTIGSLVRKLDEVVKAADDISSRIHPFLNLAWQATSVLYKVVSNQFKTDKKLVDLVDNMEQAFRFARDTKTLVDTTEKFKGIIYELLKLTIELCAFVKEYTKGHFIGRTLKISSGPKINDFKERLLLLRNSVDSGIVLHGALTTSRVSVKIDMMELQHRLKSFEALLEPMKSDTSERPRCLQNTRTEYLAKIKDWLHSPSTETNILWLNGIAGSGKSTIAASTMDYCDINSRLAAFIFFERGKSEPKSVIKTIAYQLAAFNSELAKRIISGAEQLRNITGSTLMTQFETLLLEPLRDSVDVIRDPVIIILDALDECGTTEQRREILKLLKDDFAQLPEKFRFFVTSRPENDIMTSLSLRSHIHEIKLDPTLEQSRSDVHAYINDAMRDAVTDPMPPAEFAWNSKMKILSDTASGLFIWASTVVKLVSRSDDKVEKLEELVENARSLVGLDSLYGTVLEQSGISWEENRSVDRFRKVLGLILLGKEPLSDDDIDKLSDLPPGKSHLILRRLHSVLSYEPGKPVQLHHASFADYLLSPERSGDQRWFIDTNIQRHTITARCFDIMEQLLHFNMCNLETSFIRNDDVHDLEDRIAQNIPPYLSYACRFWSEHLHDIAYSPNVAGKLTGFAYKNILYWLEVLSLTKQFNQIAGRALYDAVMWTSVKNGQLSSFLWDAYRLAGIFAAPVSQSTPQIYLSMLSLSKGESEVSKHFSQTHPAIETHRSGIKVTTACIKTFIGHTDKVGSVGFSPDGKRVVSGSSDKTIRIWDASSGEVVVGPFEGHTDSVTSVGFSPDGKRVVSGSRDKTIRIWDALSGEVVAGPFEGHTGIVTSVGFSPDGKRVVSGAYDETIHIWGASSGETVAGPFEGHTHPVWSVSFSPDGKHVVSGSYDWTIRIWDASSGEVVAGPFERYTHSVMSVSFSPDGKRFVSGSDDKTIQIWDASSGEVVAGPFEGHTDSVMSVSFSPDGKRIVSGSDDKTIRIWDASSGEVVAGPFEGHTDSVMSVSFSPDGKRVVSGSDDETIRIWDALSGEVVAGPFEGHTGFVKSVGFSPEGKRVVSGSWDPTIRIWDASSREVVVGPFEGHTNSVWSVGFSPDGKCVVSGSHDWTIRIWDASNGEVVAGPFEGHTGWVTSVGFSPDGKRVVSGSSDKMLRIWDASSGEVVAGPFEGHTGMVRSVGFSPDGKHVVSGSGDSTIRIWDAFSGEVVAGPFEGHTYPVTSVGFAPDRKRVVSGSADKTIRIWDALSGEVVAGPFEGHTGTVMSVSFSPDGKRVVSGSADSTICIWDTSNGETVAGPFEGHTHSVTSVGFSPDGKRVVSGSYDKTIRIWDASSGEVVAGPFEGHTRQVMSVSFSADGERVVSGSLDKTIRIWDVESSSLYTAIMTGKEVTNPSRMAETEAPSTDLNLYATILKWTMSDDGWILGRQGELLTWIPPDLHVNLCQPFNTAILGRQFATRLELLTAPIGTKWAEGFGRR